MSAFCWEMALAMPANLVMPAETLGIRGDFNQAALPRAMVAYRAG